MSIQHRFVSLYAEHADQQIEMALQTACWAFVCMHRCLEPAEHDMLSMLSSPDEVLVSREDCSLGMAIWTSQMRMLKGLLTLQTLLAQLCGSLVDSS